MVVPSLLSIINKSWVIIRFLKFTSQSGLCGLSGYSIEESNKGKIFFSLAPCLGFCRQVLVCQLFIVPVLSSGSSDRGLRFLEKNKEILKDIRDFNNVVPSW